MLLSLSIFLHLLFGLLGFLLHCSQFNSIFKIFFCQNPKVFCKKKDCSLYLLCHIIGHVSFKIKCYGLDMACL